MRISDRGLDIDLAESGGEGTLSQCVGPSYTLIWGLRIWVPAHVREGSWPKTRAEVDPPILWLQARDKEAPQSVNHLLGGRGKSSGEGGW